jgi:hypothetical protein
MGSLLAGLVVVAAGCGSAGTDDTAAAGSTSTSAPATTTSRPRPSAQWQEVVAEDGATNDNLGGALWYDTFVTPIVARYYATPGEAALSSDGTVALVSAPGKARGTGTAYVFEATGGKWSQVAKLVAADGDRYDGFGWSVALSGDGHTAVIGSPSDDVGPAVDQGTVYVFSDAGGKWQQVAAVRPAATAAYDGFGSSVAISRDGSTVLAGAPGHMVGKVPHAGAAFVVQPNGSSWSATNQIAANAPAPNASFGAYVALSADAKTALVTRQTHLDGDKNYYRGASYVFGSDDAWKTATQRAVFEDPNHNADDSSDQYGVNAVLSDDGKVAAVAAPDVIVDKVGGAGATYVYSTAGDWADAHTTTLLPRQPVPFGYYGSSVALSADGQTLFIGVDGVGSNGQGGAELLTVRPAASGGDPWRTGDLRRLEINAPHSEQGRFGTAVSMSADGRTLLSTSPWLAVLGKAKQGAVFVLARAA